MLKNHQFKRYFNFEPPSTMANMRDRIISECNKITPDTLHNVSELLI